MPYNFGTYIKCGIGGEKARRMGKCDGKMRSKAGKR
jgi:hypothetical protein